MPTEFALWITPAILVAVAALLLRSMSRLKDRLGARIEEVNKNLSARIGETNRRIDEVNKNLGARIDGLDGRIGGLDQRLRAVEHGQARLEGLLDGLREAIAGRRPAA